MTHVVCDRLHVTAAWLNTLPLPEPMVVVDPALSPSVHWVVGPEDALQIIATIGGHWDTQVTEIQYVPDGEPEVSTTTTRHVDHLGTDISVTVNVPGVNLPELAAEAVAS